MWKIKFLYGKQTVVSLYLRTNAYKLDRFTNRIRANKEERFWVESFSLDGINNKLNHFLLFWKVVLHKSTVSYKHEKKLEEDKLTASYIHEKKMKFEEEKLSIPITYLGIAVSRVQNKSMDMGWLQNSRACHLWRKPKIPSVQDCLTKEIL